MHWRQTLLCLSVAVAGCGGGNGGLPPERPDTTITGYAIDGPLVESNVRLYSFRDGVKGELLAKTLTGSDGSYTVTLQAVSQPVLVEVDGGYYLEDATGALIPVPEEAGLMAVANLQAGASPQIINITPLTLLSAGLAQYRLSQGVAPAQAIDGANTELRSATGINPIVTIPLNIKTAANGVAGSAPAAWYGFLLAGLSNYTAGLAAAREGVEHQDLPTLSLARLMYEDIRADGVLDGKGAPDDAGAPSALEFGGEALTPELYRSGLAQNMLAVANNSDINRSGLNPNDILAGAKAVGESRSPILPPLSGEPPDDQTPSDGSGSTPPPADTAGPTIGSDIDANVFRRGDFEFVASVADPSGVSVVEFDVDGKGEGAAADPLNPRVVIDTSKYIDGEHKIGVSAWDGLGNLEYKSFTVLFDNSAPKVTLTSPGLTNVVNFELKGRVSSEGSPVTSLKMDGAAVPLGEDGTWSKKVSIKGGVNRFTLRTTDAAGNSGQQLTEVAVDLAAPELTNRVYNPRVLLARGDGTCREAPLDSVSPSSPVYIQNIYANLKEAIPSGYTVKDLEDIRMPYLQFQVEDPEDLGVSTPRDEIAVRMTYSIAGAVKVAERRLSYHQDPTGRSSYYLLPLSIDVLHPDLEKAAPDAEHIITLDVRDLAGNRRQFSFSFWTVLGEAYCPPR